MALVLFTIVLVGLFGLDSVDGVERLIKEPKRFPNYVGVPIPMVSQLTYSGLAVWVPVNGELTGPWKIPATPPDRFDPRLELRRENFPGRIQDELFLAVAEVEAWCWAATGTVRNGQAPRGRSGLEMTLGGSLEQAPFMLPDNTKFCIEGSIHACHKRGTGLTRAPRFLIARTRTDYAAEASPSAAPLSAAQNDNNRSP